MSARYFIVNVHAHNQCIAFLIQCINRAMRACKVYNLKCYSAYNPLKLFSGQREYN